MTGHRDVAAYTYSFKQLVSEYKAYSLLSVNETPRRNGDINISNSFFLNSSPSFLINNGNSAVVI